MTIMIVAPNAKIVALESNLVAENSVQCLVCVEGRCIWSHFHAVNWLAQRLPASGGRFELSACLSQLNSQANSSHVCDGTRQRVFSHKFDARRFSCSSFPPMMASYFSAAGRHSSGRAHHLDGRGGEIAQRNCSDTRSN